MGFGPEDGDEEIDSDLEAEMDEVDGKKNIIFFQFILILFFWLIRTWMGR